MMTRQTKAGRDTAMPALLNDLAALALWSSI
jgi:hypothetical protein